MPPIATVHREVLFRHEPGLGAPIVGVRYLGTGRRLEQTLRYETAGDWWEGHRVRASEDNGRTWSDWQPDPQSWPARNGFAMEQNPYAWCDDESRGITLRFMFHRLLAGEGADAIEEHFRTGQQTMFDHNFWQISRDQGRTWSALRQLRFEDGDAFDPDNPGNERFLRTNQMYGAYGAIVTREGTIVYPASETPVDLGGELVQGVRCFMGSWNDSERDYAWEVSQPIAVSHEVSGRGLTEPALAELTDGRLLLAMRGSSMAVEPQWKGKTKQPGRQWMSLSSDGGRTFSEVTDLRYHDGEPFYSPSAFSVLRRHSRTGKLYWFGNITPDPPDGNNPRYPLYLAEVDEAMPALRRDTLTIIDDYDPASDSPDVMFSNFCVYEDRDTGRFELYMTRTGERHSHWLHSDAYRYSIALV